MAKILVVDDEIGIRELLADVLTDEGYMVDMAEHAQAARNAMLNNRPDLILLDIWMPDTDGISLLKEWKSQQLLTMPVIMMSGHATIDTAVSATKIGAFNFLEKPITLAKLLACVKEGLAKHAPTKPIVASPAPTNPFLAPTFSTTADADKLGSQSTTQPATQSATQSAAQPASTSTVVITASTTANSQAKDFAQALKAALDRPAEPAARAKSNVAAAPVAASQEPSPTKAKMRLGVKHIEIDFNQELRVARDAFELAYFEYHIEAAHGSMTRVSENTGIERTHLYRKFKLLGLDVGKNAYLGQAKESDETS